MAADPPTHRFAFRQYRLPLRTVVRTAHEVWTHRSGVIVRLSDASGRVGFGEAAPIPAFGTGTVEETLASCAALGDSVGEAQLGRLPQAQNCLRAAIRAAQEDIALAVECAGGHDADSYRAVAALLPAGRPAIEQVAVKADAGFRVFKWKVGITDIADEIALLDDLCAVLPGGAKLRLDANGAWDRRQAERWLERCAERPIEFVEQPCFSPISAGEAAVKRTTDVLLGLAHDYPTPIALDESLVDDGDVARWLELGWPGWFVVKPSLLGDAAGVRRRLEAARANVVFSSALETAIGAKAALRHAFAWRGEPKALGFGVWPLFADARFDGPVAAPFLRATDAGRIDSEVIWNALG